MAEPKEEPAEDIGTLTRRWLLEATSGTLCTLSVAKDLEGYPFGSIVPYALDERGRPLLLLADIAEHTRNAQHDPRVSLFVADPSGASSDPQTRWRVNVAGTLSRVSRPGAGPEVPGDVASRLFARYVERVPTAAAYAGTHDFCLWRLEPVRVRTIAGFGRIHWVSAADALRDPGGAGVADVKAHAIDHMNADHASTMVEMVEGLCGFRPSSAVMVDVDRAGLMLTTRDPDQTVYLSFGREVAGADIRPAIIEVLKRARLAPRASRSAAQPS